MTAGERIRDRLSLGGRLAEPRYLVGLFVVVVLIAGGVAYAVTQTRQRSRRQGGKATARSRRR